jgi:hypothetical protein
VIGAGTVLNYNGQILDKTRIVETKISLYVLIADFPITRSPDEPIT